MKTILAHDLYGVWLSARVLLRSSNFAVLPVQAASSAD